MKITSTALILLILSNLAKAQEGEWQAGPAMPTPREKLAACVIENQIYALGGSAGANQAGMDTVEHFNPASGSWSGRPSIPTPRTSLTASVVDGVCYAIGGRLNFGGLGYDTVEAYSPASGTWTARAPMPTGRFYPASAVIEGKIYVAGGATDETTIVDDFEVYDPASNTWASLPPMPSARALLAAVALDGKFYAMGGTNSPSRQDFDIVEVYDPLANQWSTVAPMLLPRTQSSAVVVDGLIYLVGGGRLSNARADVQVYDPAGDSWSMGPPLLDVRVRFAAATVANTIYVMGGARMVAPPHPGVSSLEYIELPEGSAPFQINPGLNDAWYNPDTPGQGFFISVFPDISSIFLAWFTFDTQRPAGGVQANLGEPGHRWLTAFGSYADNLAVLDIEVTSGGIFNASNPVPEQNPDGTVILEFDDCNSATVEYDIESLDLQGAISIERIALDNVPSCEELAGQ
jgi:N-acetylneuraminic acid mutarotase